MLSVVNVDVSVKVVCGYLCVFMGWGVIGFMSKWLVWVCLVVVCLERGCFVGIELGGKLRMRKVLLKFCVKLVKKLFFVGFSYLYFCN